MLIYNHGKRQGKPTDQKGAITTARKTTTSNEVKQRWKSKTYKSYIVNLRYDTDQNIIDFVESNKENKGVTPLFREAMESLLKGKGI